MTGGAGDALWTPAGLWTTVGWGVSRWWRSGAAGRLRNKCALRRDGRAVFAAPRAVPR